MWSREAKLAVGCKLEQVPLYGCMKLGLHLAIVRLVANGYSISVASSMLEIETILSDRYLKPPYGGNGSERVKAMSTGVTYTSVVICVCLCMCVSMDEFRVVKLEDVLSHLDLSSLLLLPVRCGLHCGQSCI